MAGMTQSTKPVASVRHGKVTAPRFAGGGGDAVLMLQQQADDGGTRDHERKWRELADHQDEGDAREQPVQRLLECAARDPHDRLDDQRDRRRLQAEDCGRHERHVAVQRVEEGQGEQQENRRHQEAEPRDDAARDAVQAPAEPDRELQRLGARQQDHEVERIQVGALVDPAPLLDELAMHDRDLRDRPAEGNQPQPEPVPERLAARGNHGAVIGEYHGNRLNSATQAPIAGKSLMR